VSWPCSCPPPPLTHHPHDGQCQAAESQPTHKSIS
jgi:hypothetical protein